MKLIRPVGALRVLRTPWLTITLLFVPLLGVLLSVVYLGGSLAPSKYIEGLPIALVNEDSAAGSSSPSGRIADGLRNSPATRDKVDWRVISGTEARRQMSLGKISATIVIPAGFSKTIQELVALPRRSSTSASLWPTVKVLSNQSVGNMESALSQTIATDSLMVASDKLGAGLRTQVAAAAKTGLDPQSNILLAHPFQVETAAFHPVGDHSGLGLGPFYYAIVLIMAGFLGANVINSILDTTIGYAPSEFGPFRKVTAELAISRSQTLLAKIICNRSCLGGDGFSISAHSALCARHGWIKFSPTLAVFDGNSDGYWRQRPGGVCGTRSKFWYPHVQLILHHHGAPHLWRRNFSARTPRRLSDGC